MGSKVTFHLALGTLLGFGRFDLPLQENILVASLLGDLLVVAELRLQLLEPAAQPRHEGVVSLALALQLRYALLQIHNLTHQLLNQRVPTNREHITPQQKELHSNLECSARALLLTLTLIQ